MSLQNKACRSLVLACALALGGCKALPFMGGEDGGKSLAPDFGLNSVPRQWEPTLEQGDTSNRADERPVTAFDSVENDDMRAVKKTRTRPKNVLEKYLKKRDEAGSKTLPLQERDEQADLDDDFGA